MARARASDEALVELFLDMLAAERGAGKNTLDAYRNDLADLTAHLRAAGRTIAGADTDDLRGFIGALAERGFKASSLARRLSAVRQLYRFLYAEGKRADDPAAVLEGPKRGRTLPKVLSIAEVDALLAQARKEMEDAEQPPARRLRAARLLSLLEVVYATGLRVSELVALPAAARGAIKECWSYAAKAARNGWCRSTRPPSAPWRIILSCAPKPAAMTNRNGCSLHSVRPATSPASISPAN